MHIHTPKYITNNATVINDMLELAIIEEVSQISLKKSFIQLRIGLGGSHG